MASAFTCFIDGDQSREQTAHFIQLHSIRICRRESKTDGNSKHLGQVCNPMHLQLSGAFLIHFADQPSCAWMEANWSSSTWVMQPRMWQMPKSIWKKPEKTERMAWSTAHIVDSVDDDIFPQTVWPHWRDSYGKSKGRVFNRGVLGGVRQFPS